MENIYRLKKNMVYPEKINLNELSRKTSAFSTTSWCSEPLDDGNTDDNTDCNKENVDDLSVRSVNGGSEKDNSVNSIKSNNSVIANKQFIRDRVRTLIDAFTQRTRSIRETIELPVTPSISSQEVTPGVARAKEEDTDENMDSTAAPEDQPTNQERTIYERFNSLYNSATLDSQGKPYLIWMCVAASAVMYNLWAVPLRSTFPYQTPSNRIVWMFFDYLSDTIYLIDVLFIQTRTTYVSQGFTVSEYKLTRLNYFRKMYFKLDVFSLIPLDLLFFYIGPDHAIFRLPRIFKVHTFWALIDFIDKLVASPHIIRLTRTLLNMFYLIHLNACAYYAISLWEGIGTNDFVYDGQGNAYIVCFYFATKTATSIGKNPKPTQEVEYMFMTFSWLLGVFVFAVLIGQIRDIIATATQSKTEYRKLADETLEYIRRLNLPQEMLKRVQVWFNYTWETQRTLDENVILDFLPQKTKADLAMDIHIKTLSKVKIFADCDEALLRELVLQLKSVIYLPGDLICKKGDIGKEMYIVQSGKVQVLGPIDNLVLATLSEGCVFGEISLLGIKGMNRRTADIRSYGYSNLFVLSKSDLQDALRYHPDAQMLLVAKAKELMKQNEEMERKNKATIVIKNPSETESEPKIIKTVMQTLPANSNLNHTLTSGSKRKSLPANSNVNCTNGPQRKSLSNSNKFQSRYTSPAIAEDNRDSDQTFETKVTVHRTSN
ncbi:hypothetical protein PPYR_03987 [Photinus pyralis]|uniref:Cyclic nucleotide-binding domain-containing protein n=2 Tax=Photinus pyralis TaxID=7054 RepID=A0A5N4AWT5_PHOPY|nr:cyclic nucleotide-gated cation channel beta-1 [Photinus pyralis]KAB0801801.1 hypothetical protein PPYR_03987 [Photinus pyralis]